MYGSLVVRVVVHTLDDVDFARCRPGWAVGPERGPRPTARGHVNAVHDDKSAGEAVFRLNAHGVAIARNLRRGVDAHNGMASIIDRYQVVRLLQQGGQERVMRGIRAQNARLRVHVLLSAG